MELHLEEKLKEVKGKAGIYYKDLLTGETVNYNGNDGFKPASMVKLPAFMAVHSLVNQGKLSFNEKIKVKYEYRVPSCGAFNAFTDEPVVDLETLCFLMIVISDNTAANIIFDYVGIDVLNEEFRKMGLEKTHIERKFFDSEGFKKGLSNMAVPAELGMLLEQVYRGTFVNKEVSEKILSVLLEQQCRWKIPAYIEERCQVANKTGEADDITGDAALILGDRPFVLVTIFNETEAPETDEWIRHFARDIYNQKEKEQ